MSLETLAAPVLGSELDTDLIPALRTRTELIMGKLYCAQYLEVSLGYDGQIRNCQYEPLQPYIDEIIEPQTPVTDRVKESGGRCWIMYQDVAPAQAQTSLNWHVDKFGGLIMCDTLPTQYLYGVPVRDSEVAPWAASFTVRSQSKYNPSDLQIIDSGLDIKDIETHTSYDFSPDVIHRPVINRSPLPVARTFVALIPNQPHPSSR